MRYKKASLLLLLSLLSHQYLLIAEEAEETAAAEASAEAGDTPAATEEQTTEESSEEAATDDAAAEEATEESTESSGDEEKSDTLEPGERPTWPVTVELDKASTIIEGGSDELKKELFAKAQTLSAEAAEIVAALAEHRQKSFDEYVQVKEQVEDFLLETRVEVGKLKTTKIHG